MSVTGLIWSVGAVEASVPMSRSRRQSEQVVMLSGQELRHLIGERLGSGVYVTAKLEFRGAQEAQTPKLSRGKLGKIEGTSEY